MDLSLRVAMPAHNLYILWLCALLYPKQGNGRTEFLHEHHLRTSPHAPGPINACIAQLSLKQSHFDSTCCTALAYTKVRLIRINDRYLREISSLTFVSHAH